MWISMDKPPLVKTLLNAFSTAKNEVSFNASTLTVDTVLGRRKFLSKVWKLLEPLRFLTPFAIRVKFPMKDLWVLETDYDKNLTRDFAENAMKFFT